MKKVWKVCGFRRRKVWEDGVLSVCFILLFAWLAWWFLVLLTD
jgi:hypothetical protein